MFNFIEIFEQHYKSYNVKIFIFKLIEILFQTLIFFKISRALSPEIKFFQYQFSFYYFALFCVWIFLNFFLLFFQNISYFFDLNSFYSFKSNLKFLNFFVIKQLFFITILLLFYIGNLVFPVLIDSINFSIQKNLENFWVFDQILKIQTSFFFFFILFPEIFRFFFIKITVEKEINSYPRFWKIYLIIVLLFSAIFTPTLDNSIQIIFSSLFFILYLFALISIKKRLYIPYSGFNTNI